MQRKTLDGFSGKVEFR